MRELEISWAKYPAQINLVILDYKLNTLKLNTDRNIRWVISSLVIIFVISSIFFFNQIVDDIKEREVSSIKRYGKFLEYISNPNQDDGANIFVEDILIENKTIPVIITDKNYKIIEYKNLDKSKIQKDSSYLIVELSKMRNQYDPVIVNFKGIGNNKDERQYIFFKNSYILDLIIIAPYFLIIFMVLILSSLYLIFYYSNKSEKDRLWTGLAKETAHQLGTPLSSLIGWNEYIKSKKNIDSKTVSKEIEKDLDRLKTITDRFSNIGSKPKLKEGNLSQLINNSIKYLKVRTSLKIKTRMNLDNVDLRYNEQLFSWVIENLYKNSIDAVSEDGEININLVDKKNSVIIDFIDDGKGIEKGKFKKIFSPGFTSKRRGWGLGLTLAKRIIENYHQGKIYVLKSIKNIETIIRIELNK